LNRGHTVIEDDFGQLMKQLAECKTNAEEAEKRHKSEQRKLLLEVLEISDAFERVFQNIETKQAACTPQMEVWLGNFRTVYRLLWKALKGRGVLRIENLDGLYDPHWHIPRTRVYDVSRVEGTIVREQRRGYVWQGTLLRKSEVAVITHNPEETTGNEQDE